MKYSIFQYSQEKLLEYSLDVIDALILSWFSDFFVGSMEKCIFKEKDTAGGKLFGWVKLSKVLEDLPCIGINSEKGIKRRFDGLVQKGIMERKSIITQHGKKTFYRPTEIYESLLNTKIINKNNQKQIAEETKTENMVTDEQKEIFHDHQNIHANIKNPHRTKTTVADTGRPSNISHDYENILGERKENILAHSHQNIHALNNSSTSYDYTTDAAYVKSESEKIFGENYFDPGFPQKAADFFNSNGINRQDCISYFKYISCKASQKNAVNPRGLTYRLFFQTDILQEFKTYKQQQNLLEQKRIEDEKKNELKKKTCPACGKRFNASFIDYCPDCSFPTADFTNIDKVARQKKFNSLSLEQQKKYNCEYFSFKSEMPIIERIKFLKTEEGKRLQEEFILSLDKKYGLVS